MATLAVIITVQYIHAQLLEIIIVSTENCPEWVSTHNNFK